MHTATNTKPPGGTFQAKSSVWDDQKMQNHSEFWGRYHSWPHVSVSSWPSHSGHVDTQVNYSKLIPPLVAELIPLHWSSVCVEIQACRFLFFFLNCRCSWGQNRQNANTDQWKKTEKNNIFQLKLFSFNISGICFKISWTLNLSSASGEFKKCSFRYDVDSFLFQTNFLNKDLKS